MREFQLTCEAFFGRNVQDLMHIRRTTAPITTKRSKWPKSAKHGLSIRTRTLDRSIRTLIGLFQPTIFTRLRLNNRFEGFFEVIYGETQPWDIFKV